MNPIIVWQHWSSHIKVLCSPVCHQNVHSESVFVFVNFELCRVAFRAKEGQSHFTVQSTVVIGTEQNPGPETMRFIITSTSWPSRNCTPRAQGPGCTPALRKEWSLVMMAIAPFFELGNCFEVSETVLI